MTLPQEQLSQESTYGKKSTKEVGYKECDKGQQQNVCYKQADEGSEFSDHRALIDTRLLIARLGNALESSRQFLRTMRPLLGNEAEISDESVSKWYRYTTFHTDRSDE